MKNLSLALSFLVFFFCVNIVLGQNNLSVNQSIKPQFTPYGKPLTVEISINKLQNVNGIARLNQKIPYGYKVLPISVEGAGSVELKRDSLSIIWIKLPNSNKFNVIYKLIPTEVSEIGNLNVSGTFEYVENDNKQEIKINNISFSVYEPTAKDILKSVKTSKKYVFKEGVVSGITNIKEK